MNVQNIMAERAKSRFRQILRRLMMGKSVMVEAKYFNNQSQSEYLRYSSLLGKIIW